jgi:hypothetical protein
MPRKTFAETMRSWELMLGQMRPLLEELPGLAAQHAELEALLAEAQRLNDEVRELGARRKLAARLCREAVAAGVEVRLRLAAGLATRFGTKSEKLVAFGLKPRPRTIHRRTKAERERDALKKAAATAASKR